MRAHALLYASFCLLLLAQQPAHAQMSAIPISTLPVAPTSGLLPNGVNFSVNVGSVHPRQGYVFTPAQSPQFWTFDQPVAIRFGLRGMNGPGECFRLPVEAVAENISSVHVWNPATRLLCRQGASGETSESTFTMTGFVATLQLEAVNTAGYGRGPGFIEVTPAISRIELEKSGSGPDPLVLGSTINYSFLVSNTGELALESVSVTDPLPGLSAISCPTDMLAVGASTTCTASYTVTQADVDAGFIVNTATASGQPVGGGPAVTATDSETLPPSQFADISLDKTASAPNPTRLGDTISYDFVVENTGNISLSAVAVSDPLPGLSTVSCPATVLAPMASVTCTATYTVSQADVDAGTIVNTATVTAQPPGARPAVSDTDTASVAPVAAPPTSPPGPPAGGSAHGPLRVPTVPPVGLLLLTLLLAAAGSRALRGRRDQ